MTHAETLQKQRAAVARAALRQIKNRAGVLWRMASDARQPEIRKLVESIRIIATEALADTEEN